VAFVFLIGIRALQGCGLRRGSVNPLGGGFLLYDGHIAGLDVFNGVYLAKAGTLRFTIAQVAFDNFFVDMVKAYGAEWADGDTGAAADAKVVIDFHTGQCFIAGNRTLRAGTQARGILALLARNRDIKAFVLPFHDLDAAANGIADAVVFNGAHEFTQAAPCAFFVIYR
jgi:hypothetical protein